MPAKPGPPHAAPARVESLDGTATRLARPIGGWSVRLFLRSAGLSPGASRQILQRAGIGTGALESDALRVDEQQFTRFLILLSRRARDEAWGLASRPVPLGTFHTLCRLIVNCRTLGEAIVVIGRFYRLVVPDVTIKIYREQDQAVVRLKPGASLDPERYVGLHGAALFLLYQFMCWLVDRRLPLLATRFSYARRPSSTEPLRAYDTQVIQFEQPHTELRLEGHLMSLPILGGEERLNRFLSAAPRALLTRYHDESRVSDRVKSILRSQVGVPLSLQDVAARLHMTPVTLRRHLADEGCRRFSELRDDVRRRAALDMVRHPHVKLDTVALRLGFSEYSTFHRAFRRWTGVAPTEYRERPPAAQEQTGSP